MPRLGKNFKLIFPPPLPPPPPRSPSRDHHNDGLAQWKEICQAGLTVGLSLFGFFTALFVFSPSAPKAHYLYPAYLTVVCVGITTSILMSFYFFISMLTPVFNWKIKCYMSVSCLLLSLSCSLRLCLELPPVYTPYVWTSCIIVLILNVLYFWIDDPTATSFLALSATPLSPFSPPAMPASNTTITRR